MKLLGDGRPTHDLPPLQHDDLQTGGCQVGGAYQPVVTPADDRYVVSLHAVQAAPWTGNVMLSRPTVYH